jgi:hypothetical protein
VIRASPALSSTKLAAPISRLLIVGQYLIGHLSYSQVSRPPQNLLIKWRSYAGCRFNLSTMCLVGHLPFIQQTNSPKAVGHSPTR